MQIDSDTSARTLSACFHIGRKFKPCVLSAYVITLLNGWCCSGRFGLERDFCRFCGEPGYDHIGHVLTCPALQNIVLSALNQGSLFITTENIFLLVSQGGELGCFESPGIDFVALYIYLAYRVFNACCHGEAPSKRLVVHFTKTLAMHCPAARSLIRWLRWNAFSFWSFLHSGSIVSF